MSLSYMYHDMYIPRTPPYRVPPDSRLDEDGPVEIGGLNGYTRFSYVTNIVPPSVLSTRMCYRCSTYAISSESIYTSTILLSQPRVCD